MSKKISVYELLGLIKDGKAPKKIEYKGDTYIYAGDDYSINDNREDWLITNYDYLLTDFLNEEVEILDEDKSIIEKLNIVRNDITYGDGAINDDELVDSVLDIKDKINEIIDYLEKNNLNK